MCQSMFKKAFCKMYVTICGRFCPDEGVVAGYGNRIRAKHTAKWGVQIAGMIFQTRSRTCCCIPSILCPVSPGHAFFEAEKKTHICRSFLLFYDSLSSRLRSIRYSFVFFSGSSSTSIRRAFNMVPSSFPGFIPSSMRSFPAMAMVFKDRH